MFWLRRPPYLRWVAAGALLLTGLAMDLTGPRVEPYPFASEPIGVGEHIDGVVEWREIPSGVLPQWEQPVSGVAATEIAAGDPLVPSLLAEVRVPEGWWSVSVPLPVAAAPGTWLRVRDTSTGAVVDGVVVGAGHDTGFEIVGMVAFPAEDAARVADATADDALVVMVGHGSETPGQGG
jgi:hypothetical protein